MNKQKIVLGLIAMFSIAVAFAADYKITPEQLAKFSAEEKMWIKSSLSNEMVKGVLTQCAMQLEKGDKGKPISSSRIQLYISRIQRYEKYTFFEYDSKISKSWLKSCLAFLDALKKSRAQIALLEANKKQNTAEYKQWTNYYKQTARQFSALVKSPQKVTDTAKLKELGAVKKAVVDALKEQEQAQGGEQKK